MNTALNIIFVMLIISISGCSTTRETDPLIVDDLSPTGFVSSIFSKINVEYEGVNSLSSTASRRIAILKQDPSAPAGDQITLCAEPPPDVGEAFASAISNAIKASGSEPNTKIEAAVSANYARAAATQITPLIYRTQGLQLYRDSIQSLCVDMMNGWIAQDSTNSDSTKRLRIKKNREEYNERKKYYFDEAAKLIKFEVRYMRKAQQDYWQNVGATGPKLDSLDAEKGKKEEVDTDKGKKETAPTTTTDPNPPNP